LYFYKYKPILNRFAKNTKESNNEMLVSSSLNLFLLGNGLLTIGLILNQNDTTKDSITNRNSTSATNPLETITWGCVGIQLILLLIQTKTTDF
jgi:hypothetical protein